MTVNPTAVDRRSLLIFSSSLLSSWFRAAAYTAVSIFVSPFPSICLIWLKLKHIDALSRKFENSTTEFLANSSPVPTFVEKLRKFYMQVPKGIALMRKWHDDPNMRLQFKLCDMQLYFGERLFIPEACQLQTELLKEFHSSPLGGYSGIKATLARLAASFYWPTMYKMEKTYIENFQICQQHKASTFHTSACGVITTFAYSRSGVGRYFDGFHYTFAEFTRENNHLGHSGQTYHVWTFYCSSSTVNNIVPSCHIFL